MDEDVKPRRGGPHVRRANVVVFVGILITAGAALLPTILRIREVVNKVLCVGNLRQLAIACHNYHADHMSHPPACWAQLPRDASFSFQFQNIGFLPALLPYLEQEALYQSLAPTPKLFRLPRPSSSEGNPNDPTGTAFDFGLYSASEGWYTNPTNLTLAQTRLACFRCPSDKSDVDVTTGVFLVVVVDPKALTLRGGYVDPPLGNQLGHTNYAPVAGCFPEAPAYRKWDGMLGNRRGISAGNKWADGTSNTLLIGESLGGSSVGPRDFAYAWMAGVALPIYWGLGPAGLAPDEGGAAWYRFSSRHRNVVNFAFGDASVRGLRFVPHTSRPGDAFSESWLTLMELAGYKDGGRRDITALVE